MSSHVQPPQIDPTFMAGAMLYCTRCGKTMQGLTSRSRCEPCRQIARKEKEKREEVARFGKAGERESSAVQATGIQNKQLQGVQAKRPVEQNGQSGSTKGLKRVKIESHKSGEKPHLKKSHTQNTTMVKSQRPGQVNAYSPKKVQPLKGLEPPYDLHVFQSSTDLQNSIRAIYQVKKTNIVLSACYSIVISEQGSLSYSQHADEVLKSLRNDIPMPLSTKWVVAQSKQHLLEVNASCKCGVQFTLQGTSTAPNMATAKMDCGGVVTIRIEKDRSHWIKAIQGRKVTVIIRHL